MAHYAQMAKRRTSLAGGEIQDTILRLLSVAKGNDFALPEEMLKEIEAISKEGADPAWQIKEMKKLLDRWMPRH